MTLLLLTILIRIGSFLFTGVILTRLYNYSRKHPLPESKYTLILGFIHMNHVTVLYVVSIATLFIVSLVFVLSLGI